MNRISDIYVSKDDLGKKVYRKVTQYTIELAQDVVADSEEEAEQKFLDGGGIEYDDQIGARSLCSGAKTKENGWRGYTRCTEKINTKNHSEYQGSTCTKTHQEQQEEGRQDQQEEGQCSFWRNVD